MFANHIKYRFMYESVTPPAIELSNLNIGTVHDIMPQTKRSINEWTAHAETSLISHKSIFGTRSLGII